MLLKPLIDMVEKTLQALRTAMEAIQDLQNRVQGLEERELARAVDAMRDKERKP
jgi:hypothetical protein